MSEVTLLLEAIVIRSSELVSFNIIKEKGVKSKATIQPFAIETVRILEREKRGNMADDSNEDETGSQRTRQSRLKRFNKKSAYLGNNKEKNSLKGNLQGNIAELGNNVYKYGTRDQGDRFTRTTEAIADYVGREYSKEMGLLVKNQEEN